MRRVGWIVLMAVGAGVGAQALATSDQAPRRGPGGCDLLPQSDAFHQEVSGLPEAGNSEAVIDRILADGGDNLHPDFGSNPHYGIPFRVVRAKQKRVPIKIKAYRSESDRGKQPIPRRARIEGGRRSNADRHVLVLQRDGADADDDCRLIELYRAFPRRGERNRWRADQVSVFGLGRKLPQRPDGWTSADAAGLPILPGLVRYREVKAGFVDHAIRMTFERTRREYLSPATHFASDECGPNLPPMGMRLRLRSGYPLAGMSPPARVIGQALKTYGAIVADNGSNFFISGASDRRWPDEALNDLKAIAGDEFQVVSTGAESTDDC